MEIKPRISILSRPPAKRPWGRAITAEQSGNCARRFILSLRIGIYYLNLGQPFKKMEQYDSAYSYFKRAKLLYSNDRPINKEILELAQAVNDPEGAFNAIAVLIATGDNEKMYWPLLAELSYRRKDLQTSVKYYQMLVADNPNDKQYYLYLSNTLSQLGGYEQSNIVLFKALGDLRAKRRSLCQYRH